MRLNLKKIYFLFLVCVGIIPEAIFTGILYSLAAPYVVLFIELVIMFVLHHIFGLFDLNGPIFVPEIYLFSAFLLAYCNGIYNKFCEEEAVKLELKAIETKYEQAQKVAGLITIAEQGMGTLQIADVGNLGVVENE